MTTTQKQIGIFSLPVIVGALGFFVDVYDLLLFSIIRKPSLEALHLSPEEVLSKGELIISFQMIGLVVGGIIWAIMVAAIPLFSFGNISLTNVILAPNSPANPIPAINLARIY